MTIYMKDIFKYLLKKAKWIVGLFIVLFIVATVLLVVEYNLKEDTEKNDEIILSDQEKMTGDLYYQTDYLLENMNTYQNDSIIMKIDCNNTWHTTLLYEGESEQMKTYVMSNACRFKMADYVKEKIENAEVGYEDIIAFYYDEIENNSDAEQIPYFFMVEIDYYNEEGLLEIEKWVKEFLDSLDSFELVDEYRGNVRNYELAEKQYGLYSRSYTLYSNKENIRNRLTVNGERYYNSLVGEGEDMTTATADSKGLNIKRIIAYSLLIALGGIFIQCAVYAYLYIREQVKVSNSKEN